MYELTGYFENGSHFSYHLLMIGDDAKVTLVPEPTALALLALGSLLIRQRK